MVGIEVLEGATLLHDGKHAALYETTLPAYGGRVVLKLFKKSENGAALSHFWNEYNCLNRLSGRGIRPLLGKLEINHQPALVLQYIEGKSLHHYLRDHQPHFSEKLIIATSLCQLLEELHGQGILHGNLCPENVMVYPTILSVCLIDFELASPIPKVVEDGRLPAGLSLSHIAPELTGSLTALADERADLYSLGVLLYQLFGNQLPFAAQTPQALIHAHLAVDPVPLHEQCPQVPESIGLLVQKLLAKTPEERYQSAAGVQADLEKCAALLEHKGTIPAFALGQSDARLQLRFPSALVGREKELGRLRKVWQNVVVGAAAHVWICGQPGVGKTTLAEQLQIWAVERMGCVAQGKFDAMSVNKPYGALIEALNGLIDQWLTKEEGELIYWRDKIQDALGREARLLTALVPRLSLLIGRQEPPSAAEGSETQNRFHAVFLKFLKVLAAEEHPLLLQLDDLQWADSASLHLLQELLHEQDFSFFLFVGIYRQEEALENAALMQLLQDDRNVLSRYTLSLHNLPLVEVNQFLAETFQEEPGQTLELAEVLYSKTKGNPLFITQFLKSCLQHGLLRKERHAQKPEQSWCWSLEEISQMPHADNVLELMINRFNQLDDESRHLLQYAACVGNVFTTSFLLALIETEAVRPAAVLGSVLREGYLTRVMPLHSSFQQEISYRFLHDRLLQAVYATLAEPVKLHYHLRIGQLMAAQLQGEEETGTLIDAALHLHLAKELLTETDKRLLSSLMLRAGRKAMATVAYEQGLWFFEEGIKQLPEEHWLQAYEHSLELYTLAAHAAYLVGSYSSMNHWIGQIVQHAKDAIDQAKAYDIQILAYTAQNQSAEAVAVALSVLRSLGINFPEQPSKLNILLALAKTELQLRRKGFSALATLPRMTNPRIAAAMELMSSVGPAISRTQPALFPLVVCKLVQLSVKWGNAKASIPAYSGYGILQSAVLQKVHAGYAYGQLANKLLQTLDARSVAAKTWVVEASFLDFWVHHLKHSQPILQKAYSTGLETGDLEFAASGLMVEAIHAYLAGEPLPSVLEKMEHHSQQIVQLKQELLYQQLQMFHQAALNLQAEQPLHTQLQGRVFDETAVLTEEFLATNQTAGYYAYLNKLMLAYLSGEWETAKACTSWLAGKGEGVLGTIVLPVYQFYDALLQVALYQGYSKGEQQAAQSRIKKALSNLKKWARQAPMNFKHKHLLLQAEWKRVCGQRQAHHQLYDQAAQAAHEQGYFQEEALAYELAGRSLYQAGLATVAEMYLHKAYQAYLYWGSRAKALQLKRTYPGLKLGQWGERNAEEVSLSPKSLNLESLLQAAMALSSQMKMDMMLENLLTTVMQQAGAQEGYVLINREEELEVVAKSTAGKPGIELLGEFPLTEYTQLPASIINYAYRTREEVVLQDAQEDGRFSSDATVAILHIRSVLCFPVVRQQRVLGIIYLHNTLTAGSFAATQLQVLRLLSGQIAVAMENAQFYTQLEHRVEERTRELKVQQAVMEEQNEELRALNEEKDELVNIVAHDLRSPLNQIRGMLNLIKLSPDNLTPDQQQFLDLSLKSASRLSDMIARILNTNAMETQEVRLQLEMVDLEILLEEVVTNFKLQAAEKSIALHLILPEEPVEIELDRNYAIQILENLISNALKFSPKNSEVQVILYAEPDSARIEVRDEGPGISAKDQKRLFSKFQTLSARPTAGEDSTGLGLSIAKRYVESMGGNIGCESEMGEGSLFYVEFPLM